MLPGFGDVGAALVRDPRVHLIAFTGSSAVGLDPSRRGRDAGGPGPRQAGDRRDGRQELRFGRLRRRSRRRDPGDRRLGLRLRGPEMLGRVTRARPRGDRRVAARAARGRGRRPGRRPGGPLRDRRAAADRERGAGAAAALERAPGARAGRRRPRGPAGGGVVRGADRRRRPARRLAAAARRALRPSSPWRRCRASTRRWPWSTRPSRSPEACSRAAAHDRRGRAADAGRKPVRQPGDHRGDGRAPAVRRQPPLRTGMQPAAPIISASSPSPGSWPRTRCATGWSPNPRPPERRSPRRGSRAAPRRVARRARR